ncbi:type II secretion system F family protein [Serinicoccus hydrothermalis]|uniref:type II secretion system F family protein n=1 Tax=Serinicoccus hydrothermalis TaxID=1758689 RepID=UPI0012F8FD9F|nr:type II secretion system F family protein [Serinicoccus hydrothermalis]
MSAVPASAVLVVLLAVLAAMAALVGLAPPAARDASPLAAPEQSDGRSRRTGSPGAGRSRVLRWRTRAGRRAARAERSATLELAVVGTIAAALEAGLPVARAVALAVPERAGDADAAEGPDWQPLARAAGEGQQLAPVWGRLGHVTGSPTLAAVARSWAVATRSGAPIADALRVSAHVARERQRLERAVGAASAGARATATVLTWLPVAGVALSAVLGVGPVALYGTPPALLCLGAGAVLLLVGQLLVRRLVAQVMADVR